MWPLPVFTVGHWNSEQPAPWAAGTSIDERMWKAHDDETVVRLLAPANEHRQWTLISRRPERRALELPPFIDEFSERDVSQRFPFLERE